MPTTYTAFDPTLPNGATRSGPQTTSDANLNDVALWLAAIQGGAAPSFAFSKSGGTTDEPATYLFTNGTYRLRSTNTWTSGYLTTQLWEYSNDGTTWATVCTEVRSFDGTTGAPVTTTGASGMATVWAYALGRLKALWTSFTAHAAATGAAVHGLASMAIQAASAIAVTGGTIDGTTIGVTTPAHVNGLTFKGSAINLGSSNTTVNIDWALGDYFYVTATGTGIKFTFTNLPASGRAQGITLEVNWATFTATTPWPASGTGAPIKWPSATVPTVSTGIDLFEFVCRDGTNVRGALANRASG